MQKPGSKDVQMHYPDGRKEDVLDCKWLFSCNLSVNSFFLQLFLCEENCCSGHAYTICWSTWISEASRGYMGTTNRSLPAVVLHFKVSSFIPCGTLFCIRFDFSPVFSLVLGTQFTKLHICSKDIRRKRKKIQSLRHSRCHSFGFKQWLWSLSWKRST